MKVVIYARFSSHSQTEQSIEGQLKVCYEYAKAHDYTVIGEYIDRAQSAKTSDRIEFQKIIADSDNKTFEGVLVYQLDCLPEIVSIVPFTNQGLKRMESK